MKGGMMVMMSCLENIKEYINLSKHTNEKFMSRNNMTLRMEYDQFYFESTASYAENMGE
jgi:hypothetical protein